ncbi:hypothetical protein KUF71_000229 [Frankliniella fusca]|uniref:Uncharacterized protein n=1 Tax=Frankliniella fusca TaxID=407009 RepID=A0AAE1HKQ2_9NEOP|nr:hypothetical protein KUF71_000229 [Frankliniella fusca]
MLWEGPLGGCLALYFPEAMGDSRSTACSGRVAQSAESSGAADRASGSATCRRGGETPPRRCLLLARTAVAVSPRADKERPAAWTVVRVSPLL